jgi:hypothetical protein
MPVPRLVAAWGPFMVTMTYTLVLIACLGLMGRRIPDKVREWWSRLGAWLLIIRSLRCWRWASIWGPVLIDGWAPKWDGWLADSAVVAWGLATLTSVLTGKSPATNGNGRSSGPMAPPERDDPLDRGGGIVDRRGVGDPVVSDAGRGHRSRFVPQWHSAGWVPVGS